MPNASIPVDAAEYIPNCSGPQLYVIQYIAQLLDAANNPIK